MTADAWTGPQGQGHGHRIGTLPGATLFDIQCGLAHTGWSGLFEAEGFHLVLVRSGGFLHRHNGAEAFTNAASALFMRPGDEVQVAHPLHHPDRFLAVQFVESPDVDLRVGSITVGDNADLLQRIVTAACAMDTDGFELATHVVSMLSMLRVPGGRARWSSGRPATEVGHRRMVHAAIEALLDDGFRLGLAELASLVGASPHHLSRVFHRITGTPLRTYRNQLRVRSVLARLQEGAGSLADLAVEHGFADHSHLDRVVRRHLGHRPSVLRALLAPRTDPPGLPDRR